MYGSMIRRALTGIIPPRERTTLQRGGLHLLYGIKQVVKKQKHRYL